MNAGPAMQEPAGRPRGASPPAPNGPAPSASPNAARHVQELIEKVEALPDDDARELFLACLQSLLSLYGEGLGRILQLLGNEGLEGARIRDVLVRDKLVSGLLLIHGLHPQDLETRLQGALEKLRPYLQSHGGNVELLRLENEVATLRLQGTCKTCPSSAITLELAVRQAIEQACPDLQGFEVEGNSAPDPTNSLVCIH